MPRAYQAGPSKKEMEDFDRDMTSKIQKNAFEKDVEEAKINFKSGAASSGCVTRFDLLPRVFLERVAERFKIGSLKYGDFNYRKGFRDKAFIIDRINHIQEHFNAFLAPSCQEQRDDDNLAAVGWGIAFLMELSYSSEGQKILDEIRAERELG